jgi:oligopeptide transport system ATP-binding protein
MKEKIVELKDIEVKFRVRDRDLTAIRRVSLDIYRGETLAIVGESGSGKSVLTKTVTGMLEENGRITNGTIMYGDLDLTKIDSYEEGSYIYEKNHDAWQKIRGRKIATIFQDPMTSLNPLRRIGSQITEVLVHVRGFSKEDAKAEAINLLDKVGIPNPEERFMDYPFQYSGGMRQRVVIAIALACQPEILICDEPTTALDVTVQAQILDLIKALTEELNIAVIFITHDLGVVANVADRVAVMYSGQIVEYGLNDEVFYNAQHPYTWALLSSLPQLGDKGEDLFAIPGTPPSLYNKVVGDAFAPRNPFALEIDFVEEPPMFQVTETHHAKTWLLDPRAPKVVRPKIVDTLHEKVMAILGGDR